MQLRWLIQNYPSPTFEEIKKFREETGLGLQQCKKFLTKPSRKVLQVLVYMNHPDKGLGNYWVDVPTEEIIVEET